MFDCNFLETRCVSHADYYDVLSTRAPGTDLYMNSLVSPVTETIYGATRCRIKGGAKGAAAPGTAVFGDPQINGNGKF